MPLQSLTRAARKSLGYENFKFTHLIVTLNLSGKEKELSVNMTLTIVAVTILPPKTT